MQYSEVMLAAVYLLVRCSTSPYSARQEKTNRRQASTWAGGGEGAGRRGKNRRIQKSRIGQRKNVIGRSRKTSRIWH